jgi:hypothetical protein
MNLKCKNCRLPSPLKFWYINGTDWNIFCRYIPIELHIEKILLVIMTVNYRKNYLVDNFIDIKRDSEMNVHWLINTSKPAKNLVGKKMK